MPNLKFIKFALFLFVLAFVLFSHNVSLAEEHKRETLTKINIRDVKVEKNDTEIKISGALFNPSSNIITPEITHLLILKTIDPLIKPKSDIDLLPSLIVAADEGKDYFSLKPNEQRAFSYILPFSPHIPQANYSLYLGFIRSNGQVEARYEDTVKNLGSFQKEGFLAFDEESCVLLNKEGKKFGNNDGPAFFPEESPEARCLVKNIGGKEIEVSPKILWKEVYVYGKPLDGKMATETSDQKIFFKSGETKLVSLIMPKAEKPQVYQSLVSFEDKDGGSRSFNMFFRWTIAGESARIKGVAQISPLKDSYAKGEKIDLSVDYFGSADLFWTGSGQNVSNLNNLTIKAAIKDGDGNICGEKEEVLENVIDAGEKNKVIEVVLDKKCKDMSYDVSLSSNQKSLAEESGELPKVVKEKTIANYLYFGISALMILLAFAFFRKRKIVPIHLLFVLFASVMFISGIALAETKIYPNSGVGGGTTDTGKWWGEWIKSDGTAIMRSHINEKNINELKVYEAGADFSDYFNSSDGSINVYVDYRATDSSCVNTAMKVQFEMFIKADGLSEQLVKFAKKDTGDTGGWKDKIRLPYNNASGDIIERNFNVRPSDITAFYDNNADGSKTAKTNPKLIIKIKQVGYHNSDYFRGYFGGISDADKTVRTENNAFDTSDTIKIEIPLKLPAPSVSLSAPSIVTSPNTAEVKLTTNDLSGGTYYNTHPDTTGTNGFDTLSFDATPSDGAKTQTKTVSNVWISGNSNSSQTNNLKITYTKNLGKYIGKGTYTAEATVTVKPAPTSSSSSSSSSVSISSSSSSSNSSSSSSSSVCTGNCGGGNSYNLTINIGGNCTGSVFNQERSDSIGGTKTYTGYASGDEVTLTATPGPNSSQTCKMTGGWNTSSGGNCVGGTLSANNTTNDTCNFTMTGADKSLSVSFNQSSPTSSTPADPDWYNLTFKTSGSGSGNATRYNYDDTFGWTGSKTMSNGDTAGIGRDYKFKLVPNPSSGSYFSSWSGCGSVNSDNECLLEKNPYPGADKTVTATFNDSSGSCLNCGSNSVKAYISARDTVVTDGNSTVVTWTSDNATSCEQKEGGSDTGWISASDTVSGNYTTSNFTTSDNSRTYKVTCFKGSQEADAEVTIDVGSGSGSPSVTMWADPQSVGYKKTSKIKWMASNIQASQCYVLYSSTDSMNGYMTWYTYASLPFGNGYYKSGIGSNNTAGQITGKLASDTTYKIQCKGYGPSYTKVEGQASVTVAKPVSNFTIANSSGASLVATIVEGLSVKSSSSIVLSLSGEAIGNINLSASIPAISGAKAQFSSDDGTTWSDTLSVDISAISEVKIKVIKIPGATSAGTYNTAITATDTGTGGKTKKLNVNLRVDRVSSEWEEF